ncbi:MAG: dTDP-4-dehydrorhamnose reductase [Armatimonadetes bacterium]|nr:dTDP-4-dehydrorhamnose reductase [Armatimonadota bacterium]
MDAEILLTGKNGQVGWELQRTLAPLGRVTAVDVEDVDLTDAAAVRDLARRVRPRLIVNPAAYTAVDKAEEEPDLARAINAAAPGILAEEAKALGAPMIHYSTDYVFDGAKREPYAEEDAPNPMGVYGRTKLAGEEAVRASGARTVVLRLCWVYGARGRNFMLTMLRLGRERGTVRVVDDQIGSPTWCRMIAEGSAHIAARLLGRDDWEEGVYHLTAAGQTSWCGFARALFAAHGVPATVVPITTAEYPTPARRPAYSVLSNRKVGERFGVALPGWETQLGWVVE